MRGRRMTGYIIAVVAGYALLVLVAAGCQRFLLYLPDRGSAAPGDFGVPDMAAVELTTEDGLDLTAWYKAAEDGRPTIAFFHGNAGHLGYRGLKVRPYLDAGYGVLLVEYRGYGPNPGKPSEQGLYRDGRAALAYLAAAGVPAGRTALYGESLGTGVAVELAQGQPLAAVILEAPYTSMADVGAHHYWFLPVRLLIKDRYDNLAKIGKLRAPLLVVVGAEDRVVPAKFGRRLFEAAPQPKDIAEFPHAGHNDMYGPEVAQRVIEFLAQRVN
jgi:fermentation-respiration switch protein FrsA (DUF1100 family)